MALPDRDAVSRREYLKAAVALGGAAGLSACLETAPGAADDAGDDGLDLPDGDPDAVPERQHAWNAVLPSDEHGNVRPPRHHVLRSVDLADGVAPADAREPFADALADLEAAAEWSNEGLLFTVGYSPAYFDRFETDLPAGVDLPAPAPLTDLEDPELDAADCLVHLAGDEPAAALAAEEALFGDRERVDGAPVADVADLFAPVDRRTGFVGAGLPREHRGVDGVPDDAPIPEEAPLFMGFETGFAGAQASEDRVTVADGPFAGGTTQHVSTLQLQLNAWWDQESHAQRVTKIFSPEHAEEGQVGEYGGDLGADSGAAESLPDAGDLADYAAEEGVVGHAQKAARAREGGEQRILRRDFDTTDDDRAGLHFLTLQEGISEFVAVREAVTGADVAAESAVGRRVNNGIMQYVFVRRRGNYLVPPRSRRSFPTPHPDT